MCVVMATERLRAGCGIDAPSSGLIGSTIRDRPGPSGYNRESGAIDREHATSQVIDFTLSYPPLPRFGTRSSTSISKASNASMNPLKENSPSCAGNARRRETDQWPAQAPGQEVSRHAPQPRHHRNGRTCQTACHPSRPGWDGLVRRLVDMAPFSQVLFDRQLPDPVLRLGAAITRLPSPVDGNTNGAKF